MKNARHPVVGCVFTGAMLGQFLLSPLLGPLLSESPIRTNIFNGIDKRPSCYNIESLFMLNNTSESSRLGADAIFDNATDGFRSMS